MLRVRNVRRSEGCSPPHLQQIMPGLLRDELHVLMDVPDERDDHRTRITLILQRVKDRRHGFHVIGQ